MPSKTSARQFQKLSEYLRKNTLILEGGATSLTDLARLTGVEERIIDGDYNKSDLTAKEKRQVKRIETLKNLSPARQSALILQSVFYQTFHRHMLAQMSDIGKKFLTQKKVQRDSDLPSGTRGKKREQIVILYRERSNLPLLYYPIKWFKRDKNKAYPYNKHFGAPTRWVAYGAETINMFGNIKKGGKKGTEFQGFGYHPRPNKNYRTAKAPDDYYMFIRHDYPVGFGNSLSGREEVEFPIYTQFLNDPKTRSKVIKSMSDAGLAFAEAWGNIIIESSIEAGVALLRGSQP